MKKQIIFNDMVPWIALALVSLISIASNLILTRAFSRQIDIAVNQPPLLVQEKTGRAWVEIDFDATHKRLFEGEVGIYRYPLPQVLTEIAKTGGFSLRIRRGIIEEVAGVPAKDGSWRIYRYDTQLHDPIDRLAIAANDYYHIKFEH